MLNSNLFKKITYKKILIWQFLGTKSILIETNLINGPALIAVCLGFVHVANIGLLPFQIIRIMRMLARAHILSL